jgi:predicted nucleic acid-binding protein
MKVLLDSVIVIDHLNGVLGAEPFIAGLDREAVVSVVTRSEVLTGLPPERRLKAVELLDFFDCLGIDAEIADLSADLRRRHRWKLPDAFQAALAQHHDLRLATRNTRDFPEERFPFVLVPYRL